jgi:hypothetical protein
VPRFLPHLAKLATTIRGMSFHWARVVRKDYGTMFSSTSAVMLLFAWKRISLEGFEDARPYVQVLAVAWIPCLLAYLTARVLKKRGALGTD